MDLAESFYMDLPCKGTEFFGLEMNGKGVEIFNDENFCSSLFGVHGFT
jgi:hypothetical protein